jgi:hypothetical protein
VQGGDLANLQYRLDEATANTPVLPPAALPISLQPHPTHVETVAVAPRESTDTCPAKGFLERRGGSLDRERYKPEAARSRGYGWCVPGNSSMRDRSKRSWSRIFIKLKR